MDVKLIFVYFLFCSVLFMSFHFLFIQHVLAFTSFSFCMFVSVFCFSVCVCAGGGEAVLKPQCLVALVAPLRRIICKHADKTPFRPRHLVLRLTTSRGPRDSKRSDRLSCILITCAWVDEAGAWREWIEHVLVDAIMISPQGLQGQEKVIS